MRRRLSRIVAPLAGAMLLVLFASTRAAQADPLLITGGMITLNVDGSSSFLLTGSNFSIGGNFLQHPVLGGSTGAALNIGTQVGGESPVAPSTAVIGGTTYAPVITRSSFTLAASPLLLPAAAAGTTRTFTFPFSLTGSVAGYNPADFQQGVLTPLFSVDLMGQGTGSVGPLRNVDGTQWLNRGGMTLRFEAAPAATPEPATLVLMSGGLAACLTRAARRRRRARTGSAE